MGFDAIWISPIVTNMDCGYHGYWAKNYSEIAPRFGGEVALKSMIKKAHELDIWVMIDVAYNHMGWTNTSYDMFFPFNRPEYFHGEPDKSGHCYAYAPMTNHMFSCLQAQPLIKISQVGSRFLGSQLSFSWSF